MKPCFILFHPNSSEVKCSALNYHILHSMKRDNFLSRDKMIQFNYKYNVNLRNGVRVLQPSFSTLKTTKLRHVHRAPWRLWIMANYLMCPQRLRPLWIKVWMAFRGKGWTLWELSSSAPRQRQKAKKGGEKWASGMPQSRDCRAGQQMKPPFHTNCRCD